MTRTAVLPNFTWPNLDLPKLTFFNLEKYTWICKKIIKVTCQMTKTGPKNNIIPNYTKPKAWTHINK